MENFLKIYIQKIQQNLKAVAFRTIQFFRERADFPPQYKNKPHRISNDAISNRIEYPLQSFFFESNFFGLKEPFVFDFAVCLPSLSIFFSVSKYKVWIFIVIWQKLIEQWFELKFLSNH